MFGTRETPRKGKKNTRRRYFHKLGCLKKYKEKMYENSKENMILIFLKINEKNHKKSKVKLRENFMGIFSLFHSSVVATTTSSRVGLAMGRENLITSS